MLYDERDLKVLWEGGSFPAKEVKEKKPPKSHKKSNAVRRVYGNNTSGYRDVTKYKGGWVSRYKRAGVSSYLGCHDSAINAAEAYNQFEAEVAISDAISDAITQEEAACNAHWAKHSIFCSIHAVAIEGI